MIVAKLSLCLMLPVLASCAAFDISEVEPIPASRLSEVLKEAKRQVSVYQVLSRDLRPGQKAGEPPDAARQRYFSCGTGNIGFEISKLKLALTTEVDTAYKAGISVSGLAPVGGGVSGSLEGSNTQELKYTLYPRNLTDFNESDVGARDRSAPIAEALLNLRDASIESASVEYPGQKLGDCFLNYSRTAKDDANTYQLGLKVTTGQGANVTIGLAPVDLKLSVENKSVTGNTLTVTFAQDLSPRGTKKRSPQDRVRRGRGCPPDDRGCMGIQSTPSVDQ